MSHKCPECGCTVYGGDWCDRPCWTCEGAYHQKNRSWFSVGFWLTLGLGLLYIAFGGSP